MMIIDDSQLRPSGALTTKVNVHKTLKNLEVGENVTLPIDKLTYVRNIASMLNTSRGCKSVIVTPIASESQVKIERIQ